MKWKGFFFEWLFCLNKKVPAFKMKEGTLLMLYSGMFNFNPQLLEINAN